VARSTAVALARTWPESAARHVAILEATPKHPAPVNTPGGLVQAIREDWDWSACRPPPPAVFYGLHCPTCQALSDPLFRTEPSAPHPCSICGQPLTWAAHGRTVPA
jgi:hypothetical protein